jgi:hypothetical protein
MIPDDDVLMLKQDQLWMKVREEVESISENGKRDNHERQNLEDRLRTTMHTN